MLKIGSHEITTTDMLKTEMQKIESGGDEGFEEAGRLVASNAK